MNAARSVVFYSVVVLSTACPQWLDRYAQFHSMHREDVGIPRITYTCRGKCSGFGDRIRTMLWGLRVASKTGRIFHIDVSDNFPLADVLEPGIIDWKVFVTDSGNLTSQHADFYVGGDGSGVPNVDITATLFSYGGNRMPGDDILPQDAR